MNRIGVVCVLFVILALTAAGVARADTIDGVITNYESGNKGTDMTVRTSDGRNHALWFDNMKKPFFQGRALPWCPGFPCNGWPKQLVLNKTRVRVYALKEIIGGYVIESPTRIVVLGRH